MKSNLIIVNVLPPEYFKDCHIKNTINIPFDKIEDEAKQWDRNRKIIVYCARYECTASKYAYQKLKELGFNNVSVYEGGTQEWFQKGYPTDGPCSHKILQEKSLGKPAQPITTLSADELLKTMKDNNLL